MRTIDLLIIGDYLSAEFSWQARVPQFEISNLSVTDATSTDILNTLPKLKELHPETDAIMLSIGANDLRSGNDDFLSTIRDICIKGNELFPTAEFLVTSIVPITFADFPPQRIAELNQQMATMARDIGAVSLDVYTPLKKAMENGQEIVEADGIHLTSNGYALWAKTMLEHIAFLIEEDE